MTRVKLREIFGVRRSQGSLVEGNIVKSDGTTYQDLQTITVPKMQEYLGSSETDFVTLFNDCVAVINNLNKKVETPKPDPIAIILEEWASRLSHMDMQAKSLDLSDHLNLLISKLFPNAPKKITTQPVPTAPGKKLGRPAKVKQEGTSKGSNPATPNS